MVESSSFENMFGRNIGKLLPVEAEPHSTKFD